MKTKSKRKRIAPPKEKNPSVGNMLKRIIPSINKLLPSITIILTYAFIYISLRGKILFTPDFDRSDAFHLNVSLKYYLWKTLHQNRLPFWTQQLQGGFPLLAEGQIGSLYLPNLLLYRFLGFNDAYVLSFVGSLFLFAFGFYALLRNNGVRKWTALLISISASFSGFITFRWVHLNLIQTVSLIPLLFLTGTYAYKLPNWRFKLIHGFIISQLIFAGHMQIAFLSLLSLIMWYMFRFYKNVRQSMADFLPGFFIGTLLSFPQILPTLLLIRFSGRTAVSGYSFATNYSYPLSHIFSFVTPFFYGNPKNHSYPLSLSEWGVFWENTPYIGELLSFLIAGAFIVLFLKKRVLHHQANAHFLLSAIFLVLAFGSNSPLYFIFDIPPFSLFRTPAKYLISASFFLLWGAALYLNEALNLMKNRIVEIAAYIILLANIGILLYTGFSYHVFVNENSVLKNANLMIYLNPKDRYMTLGATKKWGGYFARNGWSNITDITAYKNFNSYLIPNSNLIYGGESVDINTGGLRLRRMDLLSGLLANYLGFEGEVQETSSKSAKNLISLLGINTLISTDILSLPGSFEFSWKPIGKDFYLYKNLIQNPGYYIVRRTHEMRYAEDFDKLLTVGKIGQNNAGVEGFFTREFIGNPTVRVFADTEDRFEAQVSTEKQAFFVIAKTWYPEWNITLDGKKTIPVKTNLIHMGIPVPPGTHTVSAKYIPYSFYLGLTISFLTISGLGVFIFVKTRDRKWKI